MEEVKGLGYRLQHGEVSEEDLLGADEVFLTNAIQVIRWVKQYKQSHYTYGQTKRIFATVSARLFGSLHQS